MRKLSKSATSSSLTTMTSTSSATDSHSNFSGGATTTSSSTPSSSVDDDSAALPRLVVFDLDYTLWPFWVDTHVTSPLKAAPPPKQQQQQQSQPSCVTAAVDRTGERFSFFSDVPRILHALQQAPGVRVAVASRTHAPDLARELLKLLYIPSAASVLAAENITDGNVDGDGYGTSGAGPGAGAGPGLPKSSSGILVAAGGRKNKHRRALDFFDGGTEIYPGSKIRHMEVLARRTGVAFADMLFFDDEGRNREVEALGVTFWLVRDGMSWDELERGVTEWRRRRGGAGAVGGSQG